MKSPVLLALVFAAAALSGCALDKPLSMPEVPDLPTPRIPSVADLPFVYQIEVQQGNVITQEMIAQLRIGMDKKKVNFVMGSPIIMDTFHGNRWDYLYTIDTKGKKPRRRRITLYFEDDLLARIEGDVVPASAPLAVDTRQDMTVDVPKPEKKNVVAKLAAAVPFVGDDNKKPPKKDATTATASAEPKPAPKPRPAPPELTPIQRARLEEMAPPSMMGTLAGALPFVDAPEHQPLDPGRRDDEEEEEDVETELEEELEEDMEVEEEDEDGLFQSLTGALPFVGDKEDDEESTSSDSAESDDAEDEVEPEEDEEPVEDEPVDEENSDEADEEAADDTEEDLAADEADEDGLFQSLTEALPFMGDDDTDEDDAGNGSPSADDTATEEEDAVVSTPVAVPMPQPLENQVPEDDSANTEGTTGESKGFFDRWFGRD